MFEDSPSPMSLWRPEDGDLVFEALNRAGHEANPPTAAFIGRKLSEIGWPPEMRALLIDTSADGTTRDLSTQYESVSTRVQFDGDFRAIAGPDGYVMLTATPQTFERLRRARPSESVEALRERVSSTLLSDPLVAVSVWRIEADDDFTLADFNEGALRMTGGEVASLLGLRARSLYWNQPRLLDLFTLARDAGRAEDPELPMRFVTSQELHHLHAVAIREDEHLVVLAKDRTDEFAMARELREAEHRLRRAERLDSLGRLAGGIAHDFNNLMASVRVTADLLEGVVPDSHQADLALFGAIADRGAAMTDRLLALARGGEGRPRPTSVADASRKVLGNVGKLLGPAVRVEVCVPDDLPPALIDPLELERVLRNLVLNANAAMPRGGAIRLLAEPSSPDELACYDRELRGPSLVIRVVDEGIGIATEFQRSIFEPFVSSKPEGAGGGLGLATVRSMVRHAGGDVRVESREGHGSMFSIVLPTESAIAHEPVRRARSLRVLLVEDEELLRSVLVRLLEAQGFEVHEAANGREAMAHAEALTVDVVVSDLLMPEMNGFELAAALRAQRPEVPLVLCSGHFEGDPTEEVPPPMVLLRKPLGSKELIEAIRSVAPVLEGPAAEAGPA